MSSNAAGYGIEDLKGQLVASGNMAMGNQFMVKFPQIESFSIDPNELDIFCTAASMPGRQIMSQDYQIGTTMRKIANGFATTDISLTFIVTNSHRIRQYFEAWQAEAHNPVTKEVGYFDDYTYPVEISTIQKGQRLSAFKKQLGGLNKIPSVISNKIPDLGPVDFSQGEIDVGIAFKKETTYTCKLLECFPTTLADQAIGNGTELMELSVELSYTDWESEPGSYISEEQGVVQAGVGAVLGLFG